MSFSGFRATNAACVVIAALTLLAPDASAASEQTFDKPAIKNSYMGIISMVRLDWCWQHQQMCGKRAADLYCKSRGFQKAASFLKDPAIGATVSMGDKKICNSGICDGFASITCQRP